MMGKEAFVHLHLHSEYSLLDGACRIKEIPKIAKALGQTAVAITDHGVMYGVVDFYKACLAEGVKPIIGCEVYVAPRTRFDKVYKVDSSPYHLVLLCENQTGYQNLIKLVSLGFTEGFYSKPRVDEELLVQYHEGLIALSACLAGEIARKLTAGDYQGAKKTALRYRDIFGKDNYFLEVQNHGIKEQQAILPALRQMSQETGIPLAATNDCHYPEKKDAKMQNILVCIQTNHVYGDGSTLEFPTDEFYIKSAAEMEKALPGFEDACRNTARIAGRCNVSFTFGKTKLPHFEAPDGMDNLEYFLRLGRRGLKKRYSTITKELVDRFEYETGVIARMGYVDYYLIVYDFVRYAKSNGIPVGPGRGSGAGSLVAYCMGITDVDPIRYNLIFERFLNPERVSMPDFDIDFSDERRQEVIDYVLNRYGSDHVAQITTFGTLAAKRAVRDVAKAMGMSYQAADRVAKLIPFQLKMTVDKALAEVKELRTLYENDSQIRELLDMAKRVEGMPRNASTHAAGVVITADPVDSYVPLAKSGEMTVTQFPMTTLEELGLLKMDFLGLRNLSVIDRCEKAIRQRIPDFNIRKIPQDDQAVFDMFSRGETEGVFQFESAGMRQMLISMKPRSIEDLTAATSIYRPGPSASIPTFIENRSHPERIRYRTPELEPILKETCGCLLYQEQVMQVFRSLAGYSYGRADLVRRAMAKKKADVMEAERENFIYGKKREDGSFECTGAVSRGISPETANKIFDEMAAFAEYAFNKPHAVCYAVVSYQTAYLKCHYPREYLAALLTSVLDSSSKLMEYIAECRKENIPILPPNINRSRADFVGEAGGIRFGLLAVKGMGRGVIQAIVAEREKNGPYTDLFSFCKRLYGQDLNRQNLRNLILCGALDVFGYTRKELILSYEETLDAASAAARVSEGGQMSLFAAMQAQDPGVEIKRYGEYPFSELLRYEHEALGFYLSGHPLDAYRELEKKQRFDRIAQITAEDTRYTDRQRVCLLARAVSRKLTATKSGQSMCFLEIEDKTGAMEALVFPEVYKNYQQLLQGEAPFIVKGVLSFKEEEDAKLLCEAFTSLADYHPPARPAGQQRLFLKFSGGEDPRIPEALSLLRRFPGEGEVRFFFAAEKSYRYPPDRLRADFCPELLEALGRLLGAENVKLQAV